ncbi:hypothetical protein TYRP_022916, partial [Tyrophagus putrescentiae]
MFSFRGTGVPSLLLLFLLHFGERRPGCSEAAHQPPACPSSSHFVDAKSDKGADDVVVGVHFYKMVVVVIHSGHQAAGDVALLTRSSKLLIDWCHLVDRHRPTAWDTTRKLVVPQAVGADQPNDTSLQHL